MNLFRELLQINGFAKFSAMFVSALLLSILTNSTVYAHNVVWDIEYVHSGTSPSPINFPYDPNNPPINIPLAITASANIKIKSPSGAEQEFDVPSIGSTWTSGVFAMGEIGQYQITETYMVQMKDVSGLSGTTRIFTRIDTWYYNNPAFSIKQFELVDMYLDGYWLEITSDVMEVLLPITPEPARIGDEVLLRIKLTADVLEGQDLIQAMTFGAKLHKSSSLTTLVDDEFPVVRHTRVSSIQAGEFIYTKATDNLLLAAVSLFFHDVSSSAFQEIPMIPTETADVFGGRVPVGAKEGNGAYYIVATDVSGNSTRVPPSSFAIFVSALNFGNVNGDGVVDNADGLRVLQAVVGLVNLTPAEQLLADVTGDGTVSALDAAYIFQYAAGIIDEFPVHSGISGISSEIAAVDVELSIPDSVGGPGDSINIPINISNTNGLNLIAANLTMSYDPNILTAMNTSTAGTIAAGWFAVHNISSGQIAIAMASSLALNGAGTLINVNANVAGGASDGETSPLAISDVLLNEGSVSADTVDGIFTVNEEYGINIQLYEDWNLISIPVEVDDNNILSVLASINGLWDTAWAYDTNPGWKGYINNNEPPPATELQTIEPGKGYWLKMNSPGTLTVTGKNLTDTAISLVPGRNVVGYNSLTAQSPQSALFGLPEGSSIWGYDSLAKSWRTYVVGSPDFLNNLNLLNPGNGYVIETTESYEWVISP